MRPEEIFPPLNALLNGTSAMLLIGGYLAVRAGRIALHKICMITALIVSGLFLGSYLYYHFGPRGGQPTRFVGPEMARAVYFTILISHTILAAAVAPLALITAYLGFRDRIKQHMRLARWTLPLWIYVSVTGVVIYWMLYQLYPVQ